MKVRKFKKQTKKTFKPGNVVYDKVTKSCTIIAVVNDVQILKNNTIRMNVGTINSLSLVTGDVCHVDLSQTKYRLATPKEKELYFKLMFNHF